MKVLALQEVLEYIENLVIILYEKEYFGFKETARKYVEELYNDIETNLPTSQYKLAPKYFEKYGKDMYYAVFKRSKHTHWYVFFTIYKENKETIYLIRYIGNNHVIAQYL